MRILPQTFAFAACLVMTRYSCSAEARAALRSFQFFGEGGNDNLTINYQSGDPLPLPGFQFNFDSGLGTDNAFVIEANGTQRIAYFVNLFTDGADIAVGNGRADSSAAADDQTTLRSAIQEANFASVRTYIFVPAGTYTLTLSGTGGDTQGDFDISKDMTIIGTGAGSTIIDASGLVTVNDRIFDVQNGGESICHVRHSHRRENSRFCQRSRRRDLCAERRHVKP